MQSDTILIKEQDQAYAEKPDVKRLNHFSFLREVAKVLVEIEVEHQKLEEYSKSTNMLTFPFNKVSMLNSCNLTHFMFNQHTFIFRNL